MAESHFLDEGQVADRNEQPWLHNRVDELQRQLRLRTILLASAMALVALLGSFTLASFYNSERPTVALAAAPSFDRPSRSPSVTWKDEQRSNDRSQAWVAAGEERIEAIAAFYFDAQSTPTEQRKASGRHAESLVLGQSGRSLRGKIPGADSQALARDCSPLSSEAAVSRALKQDGRRAARADELLHYAATDFVNLRAAPSADAEVLMVVAQGDRVRRTWRDVGWLQVEYGDRPASSIRGWVYSAHLRSVDTSGEPARP
jgi:hypothetical protein